MKGVKCIYLKEDESVERTRGFGEVLTKGFEELFTVGDVELHWDWRRRER